MSEEAVWVNLDEVADEPVSQAGPPADEKFIYVDIGGVDRESKSIKEPKFIASIEAPSRAKQVLKAGDVLVSMTRPNLNAVALVPQALAGAIGSSGFCVLRSRWMAPAFLYYLVQSHDFVKAMTGLVQGALYPAVRPSDIGKFKFLLFPESRQLRVVFKLEQLFSDLDAGIAELKAAQKKLNLCRQSLLKVAVEGSLTAAWREKNPSQDTGESLLQHMSAMHRACWEEQQLMKYREQGKTAPKNWRSKYQGPANFSAEGLPRLPKDWVWVSLDMLIADGPQNGLYLPSECYGKGVPILRITDYQIGWHRERDKLNLVEADQALQAAYALSENDVLINRVNSMTHLGKSLAVPPSLEGVVYESNMMRLRLIDGVNALYVCAYLGSNIGRARLIKNAKWAVNQASINQQDVRATPIPLPPLEEQQVLMEMLQVQLDGIRVQDEAISKSLKQAAAQRQNILRAAFSGQLVPQDPADEPAVVLLERIRAERAGRQAPRRGRKAKSEKAA